MFDIFRTNSKSLAGCRDLYKTYRHVAVREKGTTKAAFDAKVKGDVDCFSEMDRKAGLEVNIPRMYAWYAHVNAYGCPPR